MAIAIDHVNIGTTSDDGVTSTVLTTTAAVASGGFIVLGVGWLGAGVTISSVSGGGLTWVIDEQGLDANGPGGLQGGIVSAQAPSGLASGTNITVSWTGGSASNILIGGSSFTGVKTSSALDTTAAALGVDSPTSTGWTTRSMTSAAGSVLIGLANEGITGGATTSTPTSPALELYDFQAFGILTMTAAYRIESSAGSYTVAGTWGASAQSVTVGAAYLASGASSGSATFPITATINSMGSPGPVAVDASTESNRTDTSDPYTFSHTGRTDANGGIQGAIVTVVHGTSSTEHVSSMTYGGVSMTKVVTATDTVTEPGRASIWFVGSGLAGKGGTQTISADLASGTTDDITFTAITLVTDDGSDIEVVDFDSISENATNPSVTLQYGGRYAISVAALYGGGAAPSSFTPNGNCVEVASQDLGAFYAFTLRQTTPGTSDFAIGGTASTDDVAYAAAAFAKVTGATGSSTFPITFGVGSAGTPKAYGASSSTFTVGISTSGTPTAYGVSATPITVTIDSAGTSLPHGVSSVPITFTVGSAGTPKAYGASSSSFTFGVSSAGTPKAYGVSAVPITFGVGSAGTAHFGSSASTTFTVGISSAGTPTAYGVSSTTETVSISSSGTPKAYGASSSTYTLGVSSTGTPKAYGVSAVPIAFNVTSSGTATQAPRTAAAGLVYLFGDVDTAGVFGFSEVDITFGVSSSGTPKAYASASMQTTVNISSAGSVPGSGSATTDFTFGVSSSGTPKAYGSSTVVITVGVVSSGSFTPTASSTFPITFGVSSAGAPTVYAASATAILFNVNSAGVGEITVGMFDDTGPTTSSYDEPSPSGSLYDAPALTGAMYDEPNPS